MIYDIAGVRIAYHFDFPNSTVYFGEYLASTCTGPDVDVYLRGADKIEFPEGKVMSDEEINWCIASDGSLSIAVTNPLFPGSSEIICRLDIGKDWKTVNVLYSRKAPGIVDDVVMVLGNLILRYVILMHKGIILHASAIKWNGRGIVFAAPSGTGKSTHTGIWRQHYGVVILNDDTPVLKLKENEVFVFGTPWSGSKSINTNDSAHLDMIVVLQQAAENSLSRLDTRGILQRLVPEFLMPFCDDARMKLAYDYIGRIIELTPVYLLKCRPDKEAADMVLECLKELKPCS